MTSPASLRAAPLWPGSGVTKGAATKTSESAAQGFRQGEILGPG